MVSKSYELIYGVCRDKAKWILDLKMRPLFDRLARAMNINVVFKFPNQTALMPSLSPHVNSFSENAI